MSVRGEIVNELTDSECGVAGIMMGLPAFGFTRCQGPNSVDKVLA